LSTVTRWTLQQVGDCTLTAAAADWAAIQRGDLDRFNAWTGRKLKIDGA
jgi:hypothetical protein